MPQLRKDLFTGNWVIIAEERGHRPQDFKQSNDPNTDTDTCPFEPGNEEMTPPEIDSFQTNGGKKSDWLVRVVPNKFKALSRTVKLKQVSSGIFHRMNATGSHEVVIETPQHSLNIADFSRKQMKLVLEMFVRRLTDLEDDKRCRFVQIFRNDGRKAGASLVHPHSQILSFPFIPQFIKTRLQGSSRYYRNNQSCIVCNMLNQEREEKKRIIFENDHFIHLAPYASQYPFQTLILPKRHMHDFTNMEDFELESLSECLPDAIEIMNKTLGVPPYNLLLRNSPDAYPEGENPKYLKNLHEHYHWHLEIIPRLKKSGGLELATNTHINTISPESTANLMRTEHSKI